MNKTQLAIGIGLLAVSGIAFIRWVPGEEATWPVLSLAAGTLFLTLALVGYLINKVQERRYHRCPNCASPEIVVTETVKAEWLKISTPQSSLSTHMVPPNPDNRTSYNRRITEHCQCMSCQHTWTRSKTNSQGDKPHDFEG